MEEWKIITNYPQYSVSNQGKIKNNRTQRILKPALRNGYDAITLCKNNTKKTYHIHSIVANQFLTMPSNEIKYVINHKNEIKTDNRLENLEYITQSENIRHSYKSSRSITINTKSYDLTQFREISINPDYMISHNGDLYSKKSQRLQTPSRIPAGYYRIAIKNTEGVLKSYSIHVLVAMTYLQYVPSTSDIVINHIDGNKGNNHVDNLEIITQKENMRHSVILNDANIFRRAVFYHDEEGIRHEFPSAKVACISTGIDNSTILKSCKSDVRLAGTYRWYFI